MAFTSDVVSIEKNGHVGTLWLDRADKFNALSPQVWQAIPLALAELSSDQEVRVVIFAGRGSHFCVGLDLVASGLEAKSSQKAPSEAIANLQQMQFTTAFQQAITSLEKCPLPVIAVVQGHCLGAGIDLITACDIRLGAANANFSVRETRIGLVADVGTLQRLPNVISAGHVADLAYTARDIDAARAEKIGLINDVYESFEATYAAAQEMAAQIAANPPMAVQGTKFILQQSQNLTTEQSLLLNGLFTMATSLKSNDLRESMAAFVEKRAPNFTGT
jgi:enoyl-CoA hydratase